jgi:hypothetical protein
MYSKGIPRLINVICDNALLIAFASSQKDVSANVIGEVARDLKLTSDNQLTEKKTNVPVFEGNRRTEAFVVEASVRNSQGKSNQALTVAVVTCFLVAVFIGFASFTEPRRFFMQTAGKLLNAYQKNLIEWALVVTDQTIKPETITPKVATAKLRKVPLDLRSKDHPVTIQNGSTIFQIATDAYGTNAVLGMDLIKEFNPEIQNLNWVNAGQELLLPALTQETLLRQQADGSFRLAIASFLSRREADSLAERVMRDGFKVIITARRVSNNLVLHRLEIDRLKDIQDVNQTIQVGSKNRWIPFSPRATDEHQEGQAVTGY